MRKYNELDAAILLAINGGATDFGMLVRACGSHIEVATHKGGRYTDERMLDRRLQALRKRGLIRFKGGKWEVCQ